MKIFLLLSLSLFLTSCLFKFSGTDNLYSEGKKSDALMIKRHWCSQCGCEAIGIEQMEKKKVVYEMVLNCTEGCPPRSYKIERKYEGGKLVKADYYLLVKTKDMVAAPLTLQDSLMISKLQQFRNEPFFQHYCLHILSDFKGVVPTDSATIARSGF